MYICRINSSLSYIAHQSVVYFNIAQAGTRFISMEVFYFLGSSVLVAFELWTSLDTRPAHSVSGAQIYGLAKVSADTCVKY